MTIHTTLDAGNIEDAQSAFAAFCTDVWNGPTTPSTGIGSLVRPEAEPDTAITYSLQPGSNRKEFKKATTLSLIGLASGSRLPPRTCAVVNLRGPGAARREIGRVYQPPMDTTSLSLGLVTAAAVTRIINAWQYALDNLATTTYQPVIWHRDQLGTSDVVSIDMTNLWYTQRRRTKQMAATRTTAAL
jgi:hypothetical protein